MGEQKTKTEQEIYAAAYAALNEALNKPAAYSTAMRHGVNEVMRRLVMFPKT